MAHASVMVSLYGLGDEDGGVTVRRPVDGGRRWWNPKTGTKPDGSGLTFIVDMADMFWGGPCSMEYAHDLPRRSWSVWRLPDSSRV